MGADPSIEICGLRPKVFDCLLSAAIGSRFRSDLESLKSSPASSLVSLPLLQSELSLGRLRDANSIGDTGRCRGRSGKCTRLHFERIHCFTCFMVQAVSK